MANQLIELMVEAYQCIINERGFTDLCFTVFTNDHILISPQIENGAFNSFWNKIRKSALDIARSQGTKEMISLMVEIFKQQISSNTTDTEAIPNTLVGLFV